MTLATDIADDQDIWDDLELSSVVTLRTRRAGGATEVDITLANARKTSLRRTEGSFGGSQIGTDGTRWLIKQNTITASDSTIVVREGDLILVGTPATPDESWKVDRCSLETFNTIWSCDCTRQDA